MKRSAWLWWLGLGLGAALAATALVVGLVVGIGRSSHGTPVTSQPTAAPGTAVTAPPGSPFNSTSSSTNSNATDKGNGPAPHGSLTPPSPPGVASKAGSAAGSFPPPSLPPPLTLTFHPSTPPVSPPISTLLPGASPPQSVSPLGVGPSAAGAPGVHGAPLATPSPHAAPPAYHPLAAAPARQDKPPPFAPTALAPSPPLTSPPSLPPLSPPPTAPSLLSPSVLPHAATPPLPHPSLLPPTVTPAAPPPSAQAPSQRPGAPSQAPSGVVLLGPKALAPVAPVKTAPAPRATPRVPAPGPLPTAPGESNRVMRQALNYTKLLHQDPADRYLPCSDIAVLPDGTVPRRTVTIQAKAGGPIWRGWGTSLTWWPRLLSMYPARFYTPLMNLVFSRRAGLGLNMVRYNIPAGHKPHLSPSVSDNPLQAQGFRPDPSRPYNWSADAAQVRVLRDSRAYGATVFEAISYSPPWWMTKSGDVSGGNKGEPNLRPSFNQAFADYIADVVDHFKRDPAINVQFDYVAPFNEPVEGWWTDGRVTEGCGFDPPQIGAVIECLAFALRKRNLSSTGIAVLDSWTGNTIGAVEGGWKGQIPARQLRLADHFAVHGYVAGDSGRNETTDRSTYLGMRAIAEEWDKEVFQTEWGPLGYQGVDIQFGVLLARVVMQHVNHMGASAWFVWQAIQQRNGGGWGALQMPLVVNQKSKVLKTRQFYILRQLVFAMPPGSRPLKIEENCGAGVLAAYIGKKQRLSVTIANQRFAPFKFRLDLAQFQIASGAPRVAVKVYRTSTSENFTAIDEYSIGEPLAVDLVASPLTVTTVLMKGVVRAHRW